MKTRQLSPISMLEIWGDMGACLRDTLHGGDPGVFIVALNKVIGIRGVTSVARYEGLFSESIYRVLNGKSIPCRNGKYTL